jgi:archaeal chaperonin
MLGGQPIFVLKEGTQRESGKNAQNRNIAAARAIADAVRSTLGPKGMDKMLVDSMGDVVITNDGVTILKEIDVEHPAAKMVVEVAKTQDEECGDGTTSAVIISGELLKQAEMLIDQSVHPTIISNGYRMASEKALEILKDISIEVTSKDKKILKEIAMTAMTGKSVGGSKEYLANITVQAVQAVSEELNGKWVADIDNIKVEKKHGGSVADSQIIEGIIIDKEPVHPSMPRSLTKAKIALVNSALEVKKTEVDAKIQITDPTMLQAFLDEEERMMKKMADRIVDSGANMVISQKGIDDYVQYYLAKAGIMAIRRAKKSDMEKLAKATGARIVTTLDELTKADLGAAGAVEATKISDDEMTFVTGCKKAKSVSILLRGGTDHVVDEIERAVHDALSVVSIAIEDGYAVAGGGAPETELALRLKEYAATIGGREQLAIEAFATSLEIIPRTLAENAGLDAIDSLVNLRSAHEGKKGNKYAGLNAFDGKVVDMRKMSVVEPLRVKTQGITSATEVATMILRIDDVIASKGGGMPPMPPGGGMGGMPDMGGMGY